MSDTQVESTDQTPTPDADADVSAATDQTTEQPPADDTGADALGDAGKRALDAMKGKWHTERDKRRELESRIAELEAASAPADDKSGESAAAEIRRQATREANAKANARILRSELKAAAVGKLADPTDALALLETHNFEVDANGDVDAEELSDAIEELLTRKPHWAATGRRPVFKDSGDGGAARKVPGPSQLSREDLKGMSPEAIVKAKADGRLKDLLGG